MGKLLCVCVASILAVTGCAAPDKNASADAKTTEAPPAASSPSYVVLTSSCPQEQKVGGHKTVAFLAPLLAVAAPYIAEVAKFGVAYVYDTVVTWLKERERKYSARSTATTNQDYAFYQVGGDGYLEPSIGCIIFYRGKSGDHPGEAQAGRVDHYEYGEHIELYAEFKVESALTVPWYPIKDRADVKKDWPVTMRIRPLVLEYLEGGTELGKEEEKNLVFDLSIRKTPGIDSGGLIASASFDFGKLTAGSPDAVKTDQVGILGPSPSFLVPVAKSIKVSVPQLDPSTNKTNVVEATFVDPVAIQVSVTATEVGKGGQIEKFAGQQLGEHRDDVLKPFGDWLEKAIDAYVKDLQKQQAQ